MIKQLSLQEVKYIAFTFAKETLSWQEPIPEFDSRHPHILESCLETPFQKFAGKDLYIGIINKGAILFYLMIKNHPFQNGNKRIALTTLIIFFYLNKKWIKANNTELYNLAVEVAKSLAGEKNKAINNITTFLKKNITENINS